MNALAIHSPQQLIDYELEYLMWTSSSETHYDSRMWYETLAYESPVKMSFEQFYVSDLDVEKLAYVFHASYERSADGSKELQERATAAKKWYDYFQMTECSGYPVPGS